MSGKEHDQKNKGRSRIHVFLTRRRWHELEKIRHLRRCEALVLPSFLEDGSPECLIL